MGDFDESKQFKAWFTCPHCRGRQYYTIAKGQTWTNRSEIKCCVCNITFPAHLVPEYAGARAAAAHHGLVEPAPRRRDDPLEPLAAPDGRKAAGEVADESDD